MELGSAEAISQGWELGCGDSPEAECSDEIESTSVDDSEFSGCCPPTASGKAVIVLEESQDSGTWTLPGALP